MDAHTSTTLEALERTAAWVQQVQVQVEKMKNSSGDEENPAEEMHVVENDDLKMEPSDKDDNSLTDHHDEALKMAQVYQPSTSKNDQGGVDCSHIDVRQTVKEFKEALEKYGISQRFACLHVMENTSQGNLSFLLDKGKNKLWSEISPRGRIPYIRMRRWLDSPEEQKATLDLLHKSKDYRRGTRIGGETILNRREKFSVFQLLVLCRVFEEDQNPSLSTRTLLANKLEAPLERITIWFQNQRARGFPAKKLLKESNLSKDTVGMKLSDMSNKRDHGMRKSNTPLSNGNANESLPLDFSKMTGSSSQSKNPSSTLNDLLGTVQSSSSNSQSTSFPNLPPVPLQLLNMPQQMTLPQNFANYPYPHIYTQTNLKNSPVTSEALNFLSMYQPMTVKQEPEDSERNQSPVAGSSREQSN